MTTLFRPQSQNTKQFSTFAYEIGYYPWTTLGAAHKKLVSWRKSLITNKFLFLRRLDETLTQFYWGDDPKPFRIQWEYGNIPTAFEWETYCASNRLRVDLRISPCIPDGGRIALLSFVDF